MSIEGQFQPNLSAVAADPQQTGGWAASPQNPYVGLRPFTEEDVDVFFGRREHIEELLARLSGTHFIAVVGTSGSGKSSLVRAGLIPRLRVGWMVGRSSKWNVITFRPQDKPIRKLATHLRGCFDKKHTSQLDDTLIDQTEKLLRASPFGLIDAVQSANLASDENILIVVDQFEELFRYAEVQNTDDSTHPASNASVISEPALEVINRQDEAEAFVNLLLEVSRKKDLYVYVLITMRSEFLGDCARAEGLPDAVNRGVYLVPQLTREQLNQAIVCPLDIRGGSIADELIARIMNDISHDQDQLPVLQHALMRCWRGPKERIELADYEAVGGTTGALSNHANWIYDSLPDDAHRRIAEGVFRCITKPGLDQEGLRRPVRLKVILEVLGCEEKSLKHIISEFRAKGSAFLMPPPTESLDGDPLIDLSHESLIRKWEKLKEWIKDESESGYFYRERLLYIARMYSKAPAKLVLQPSEISDLLKLQTQKHWNEAWSTRYGGHFRQAIEFLRVQQELSAKRTKDLEHARSRKRLARAFGLILIASVVLGFLLVSKLRATAVENQHRVWSDFYADLAKQRAAVLGAYSQEQSALLYLKSIQWWNTVRNGDISNWESYMRISRGSPVATKEGADSHLAIDQVFVVGEGKDSYRVIADPTFASSNSEFLRVFKFDQVKNALVDDSQFPERSDFSRFTAISSTGRFLASRCSGSEARILDRKDGTIYSIEDCKHNIRGILDAEGYGRFVAVETTKDPKTRASTTIRVCDTSAGKLKSIKRIEINPQQQYMTAILSPDARYLGLALRNSGTQEIVSSASSYTVEIRNLATSDIAAPPVSEVSSLVPMAFSGDGRLFAVGKSDGTILLYENVSERWKPAAPRKENRGQERPRGSANTGRMPTSDSLVALGYGISPCLAPDSMLIPSHQGEVKSLAFTNNNKDSKDYLLASAGADNIIRVFDLSKWQHGAEACPTLLWSDKFGKAASQIVFSPKNTYIGLALGENTARVKYALTGVETARVVHQDRVNSIAFSPDETLAFSNGADTSTSLFSFKALKEEFPSSIEVDCRQPTQASTNEAGNVVAAVCPMVNGRNNLTWVVRVFRMRNQKSPITIQTRTEVEEEQKSPLMVYDTRTSVAEALNKKPVCHAAVSGDGNVAAAQCGSRIVLMSLKEQKTLPDLSLPEPRPDQSGPDSREMSSCFGEATTIALNGSGSVLGVGDDCGRVATYSMDTTAGTFSNTPTVYSLSSDPRVVKSLGPHRGGASWSSAVTAIAYGRQSGEWAIGTAYGVLWIADPGGRSGPYAKTWDGQIGSILFEATSLNAAEPPPLIFGAGGTARILNSSREPDLEFSAGGLITAFAFSSDGKRVALGTTDGHVSVLNLNTHTSRVGSFFDNLTTWKPADARRTQVLSPVAVFSGTPGWIVPPISQQADTGPSPYIFSLQFLTNNELLVGTEAARVIEGSDRESSLPPNLSFTIRDLSWLEENGKRALEKLCPNISQGLQLESPTPEGRPMENPCQKISN